MFLIDRFRRQPPLVPVLRLAGVIGNQPYRGGLSLAALTGQIERAFSARGAVAVALQINSPGGSPVQSALIHGRIRQLATEKRLPVVAFAEDVAASGGYWLALAADEVFADTNSIVGSIGVVSAGFGFQGVLERLGVERRVHTQGAHKAMLDPFRPEKAEDVARLHAIQRDMHDSFKSLVRERRGTKLKADDATLFEGDIWTGQRALALGLIDGIGDLRSTMRARYGDKVRLRLVGDQTSWLRRRLGFSGNLAADAMALLDERALWARYGL
jgi:serine protease SohB